MANWLNFKMFTQGPRFAVIWSPETDHKLARTTKKCWLVTHADDLKIIQNVDEIRVSNSPDKL